MIISILLASLTLVGFSLGDDPTISASTDATTTVSPTYHLFDPTGSPSYGLNETVSFTWEATGYTAAFYVCHSSISTDFAAHTNYWISSSSYFLAGFPDGDETFVDVASLGQTLSQNLYTDWPATCFFGMRDQSGNVGYGNEDFFITTSSATSSSTLAPGATTAFVTPSSTAPPPGRSMVQSTTTTAIQPPPIATSPAALPEPGGNSGLSGSAIAGIAIGSISGVLALVGVIAWRKIIRRRTSNSEALLSGFAPIKDSYWKKPKASELTSSNTERGEGVVHEMSAADPVTVFELESPRYEGQYEMAEK